jgi:hypothetical protein
MSVPAPQSRAMKKRRTSATLTFTSRWEEGRGFF